MSKLSATRCDVCGVRKYDDESSYDGWYGPILLKIAQKGERERVHNFEHACRDCGVLIHQHLNSCTRSTSVKEDREGDIRVAKREAFFKEMDEILANGTSHTAEQIYKIEAARKKMLEDT